MFSSFILTIALCAQGGAFTGAVRAQPVLLRSSAIPSPSALQQGNNNSSAVPAQQTSTAARGLARVKRLLRLFVGLTWLVLVILVGQAALILLPLVWGYRRRRGRSPTAFVSFARAALATHQWWLWLLGVTDVFLLANHLLVRGRAFGVWDVNSAFYPYQVLVADFARAGRLVQWDPWSYGGLPMGSDPQVGAFSPVNVLIGLIFGGTTTGFIFYWLFIWWLGGVGVMLLARQLKAPPWGGSVVALGFLFCGFYTGHAEHTSSVLAFSAVPLVIWRLEAALSSQKLHPAVEAGAIWGLSALAGYPAQTILTGCYAALWAVGRWLCTPASPDQVEPGEAVALTARRPSFRHTCYSLALLAAVGGLVLLPSYFAFFYEGAGTHTRIGALIREIALKEDAFTPGALASFASPFVPILKLIYGVRGIAIWPRLDVSMCSIYAGALITVLACFALVNQPRDKWRWWLLGLALFSLGCTFGDTLPLRGWLYDWFYPTRFFRHPAIFRAYYLFSLVPLALLATRELNEALPKKDARVWRRLFIVSVLIAVVALLGFLLWVRSLPAAEIQPAAKMVGYAQTLGVWLGIAMIALLAWRWSPRLRQRWLVPLLVALAASDAFLTSTVSVNMTVDLDGIALWQRLAPQRSTALDLTAQGLQRAERSAFPPPFDNNLNNDQILTKLPAFDAYSPAVNDFHKAFANDPLLKDMAVGRERIWFAQEIGQVALTDINLATYLSRATALGGFPLVVHAPEQMLRPKRAPQSPAYDEAQIAKLPAAERVAVKVLKYTPEELVFDVQCPANGWLLVTDRWARSWKAEVNAHPVTVYGGNFIFRALPVSAGANHVRFTYRMLAFPWLIVLGWGTLAGVLAAALYRARAAASRPAGP